MSSGDSQPGLFGALTPAPLAERLRPRVLAEVAGQEHLTGPDGPLQRFVDEGQVPSLILWGPPGSGKTTLARILGTTAGYRWEEFSAVLSGVKDVREALARSRENQVTRGVRTLLFIDEIHRFNRAQQDAFLAHVEAGTVTLVGATTENPSFSVTPALLSRCQVYVLRALGAESLRRLGERALGEWCDGVGVPVELEDEAWSWLLRHADGDARKLLQALELGLRALVPASAGGTSPSHQESAGEAAAVHQLTSKDLSAVLQRTLPKHSGAEDHFDWISAFQKSIRGSDPDGALYWLARMLESGEDPLYVSRRLIRTASEDVGMAEPQALSLAVAAKETVASIGMPECALALAQATVYLALAPKSNSLELAYGRAVAAVRKHGGLAVPMHVRNAPTRLLSVLGYGAGYAYPHDAPGHWLAQRHLPEPIERAGFYRPAQEGREPRMVDDHRRRTRDFYELRFEGDNERPPESSGSPPTGGQSTDQEGEAGGSEKT